MRGGEQPLPPYGACLLGSHNLVKYVEFDDQGRPYLNLDRLKRNIPDIVRAMDNIVDRAIYPLPQQEQEAKSKRRMGLGVTGLANALEIMGYRYGSTEALDYTDQLLKFIAIETYKASIELAKEKGPFPLYDEKMLESSFMKGMPTYVREDIRSSGIRNSHLLSNAPTGTISLYADNISSGIEPVFSHEYSRTIQTPTGPMTRKVVDYAYYKYGIKGVSADKLDVMQHVDMLNVASKWVDSACSKTCNVGPEVTWEKFKDVYMRAYEGGASGCTTFRSAGKRFGILNVEEKDEQEVEQSGAACYIDPETGIKTCDE